MYLANKSMDKSAQLAAPLTLTEKIKTPLGSLRIVLSNYQPSGRMSVELMLDKQTPTKSGRSVPVTALSFDSQEPFTLSHGEFAAKPVHEVMTKIFLDSGLFKSTGKVIANGEIWRLSGTALLEFNSAFAPLKGASWPSFPSHLFGRKQLNPAGKKMLRDEFDVHGYTEHSPAGESVWVVREYCEQNKIPFVIYLVNENEELVGARVCKAEFAEKVAALNAAAGYSMVTVYESPRFSWQVTEHQAARQ